MGNVQYHIKYIWFTKYLKFSGSEGDFGGEKVSILLSQNISKNDFFPHVTIILCEKYLELYYIYI